MTTTSPPGYDPAKAARTGRLIGGGMLATVGAVIALGGGAVLALGGSNGEFGSGQGNLSTSTSALVTGVAKVDGTKDVTDALGHPRVTIDVDSTGAEKNVFVGIGRKADVDRYLAGAQVDRVNDFTVDPWPVTKTRIDGTAHPKPPGTQSFWVARSSGSSASLHWKVRDGAYRVVVMNADASPGVHTMSGVSVKIPHLATASLVALIIGLVMAGGGVALMALPTRGRRDGAAPGETGTPAAQYAIG